jgi:hypothetical protein
MDDIEDEYDAYNLPLDAEHLPYVLDLPPSRDHSPIADDDGPLLQTEQEAKEREPTSPRTPKSATSDEFSAYDLSEFTTEELVSLESRALKATSDRPRRDVGFIGSIFKGVPAAADHVSPAIPIASTSRTLPHTTLSGPAINIELEQSYEPPAPAPALPASSSHLNGSVHKQRESPKGKLTLGKWFRVTDLTGPAWCVWFDVVFSFVLKYHGCRCEYQYEYGRLLSMEERKIKEMGEPQEVESIVSMNGTIIPINGERMEQRKATISAGTVCPSACKNEARLKVYSSLFMQDWSVRFTRTRLCCRSRAIQRGGRPGTWKLFEV